MFPLDFETQEGGGTVNCCDNLSNKKALQHTHARTHHTQAFTYTAQLQAPNGAWLKSQGGIFQPLLSRTLGEITLIECISEVQIVATDDCLLFKWEEKGGGGSELLYRGNLPSS